MAEILTATVKLVIVERSLDRAVIAWLP